MAKVGGDVGGYPIPSKICSLDTALPRLLVQHLLNPSGGESCMARKYRDLRQGRSKEWRFWSFVENTKSALNCVK